ncbi:MAG: MFS transporter [Candidatus Njordarchaeales archaeon]
MSLLNYLERVELKRFHYRLLIIASLTYMLTAMNVLLISGVLKRLGVELALNQIQLSYLLSSGFVGMFFGALLFGRLADIIGRKWALIITITIHGVFTALCGTTHDYELLLLYRFIAGIGLGGALPIPGVYISEYTPAKYRGTFVGLVETAWVWGAILSLLIPLVFIETIDWEGVLLWGLLALILVPLIVVYLPESIRYLEEKGRIDKAIHILKKYSLVVGEVKVSRRPSSKVRWIELFRGEYAKRTILLMSLWFILVYTYYGVFLWLPKILADKYPQYSLLVALSWSILIIAAQIPGYYSAAFLLDKLGRKKVLAGYLIGAGIGSIIVSIADYWEIGTIRIGAYSIGLLLSAGFIIVSFFNLGAWSGLYTYTPELYPTDYRGTGAGIAAATGRVAGIIAPVVTGLLQMGGSLVAAYLVFFFMHLIGGLLVIMIGPETKGLRLEDISK